MEKDSKVKVLGLAVLCLQFGCLSPGSDSKTSSIRHSRPRLCFSTSMLVGLRMAETVKGVPAHTCLLALLTATEGPCELDRVQDHSLVTSQQCLS